MQLFYNPDITADAVEATFPKDESKHIVKVLRKRTGDLLNITNGNGNFFKAEISASHYQLLCKKPKGQPNGCHYCFTV